MEYMKYMKYLIAMLIGSWIAWQPAQASGTYDLDFEAQKSQYPDMIISWQVVNDVPQVCAQAAAIRGIRAQYNPHMIACALTHRNGTACIIFTQKKLSLAILGHELRHCFEGAWHP